MSEITSPQISASTLPEEQGQATSILDHPFRYDRGPIVPDIATIMAGEAYTYKPPGLLAYFEGLKDQEVKYEKSAGPKLVIPSIKRDLVFKQGRNVHARPFLQTFMEFLLPLESKKYSPNQPPPFAVFLWSTAMPHTLLPMLETYLKPWKSQILGVWNRQHLELRDAASYRGNPDTFKDLDKLFTHLGENKKDTEAFLRLPVDWQPSVGDTILIEESISKCRLQPLNLLPITDYDENEHSRTIAVIRQHDRGAVGASEDDRADLLRLVFGCESKDFYAKCFSSLGQANIPGYPRPPIMQVDAMLLAVIGILSELQDVANVPVWIAAGGLKPSVAHTFTESIAQGGWARVLQLDDGFARPTPSRSNTDDQDSNALSSFSDGEWYHSPILVLYWVRRGLKALKERGIVPQHAVNPVSQNSW